MDTDDKWQVMVFAGEGNGDTLRQYETILLMDSQVILQSKFVHLRTNSFCLFLCPL